jgi:hypothetical protein
VTPTSRTAATQRQEQQAPPPRLHSPRRTSVLRTAHTAAVSFSAVARLLAREQLTASATPLSSFTRASCWPLKGSAPALAFFPPPPTIMATPSALPSVAHGDCRARNAMAATQRRHGRQRQRGDSRSSYRARAWCVSQEVPPWLVGHRLGTCKVAAVARNVLLSDSARGGMTRCYTVLRRWPGLTVTPDRAANYSACVCLRVFQGDPRGRP